MGGICMKAIPERSFLFYLAFCLIIEFLNHSTQSLSTQPYESMSPLQPWLWVSKSQRLKLFSSYNQDLTSNWQEVFLKMFYEYFRMLNLQLSSKDIILSADKSVSSSWFPNTYAYIVQVSLKGSIKSGQFISTKSFI